jgi:hypothetical protein
MAPVKKGAQDETPETMGTGRPNLFGFRNKEGINFLLTSRHETVRVRLDSRFAATLPTTRAILPDNKLYTNRFEIRSASTDAAYAALRMYA